MRHVGNIFAMQYCGFLNIFMAKLLFFHKIYVLSIKSSHLFTCQQLFRATREAIETFGNKFTARKRLLFQLLIQVHSVLSF